MMLRNEADVRNTRAKLERLEARCKALQSETREDEQLRELTLVSLGRVIKQLKEEIIRFEAARRSASRTAPS